MGEHSKRLWISFELSSEQGECGFDALSRNAM